jgi:hypothetical protein
MGFLVFVGQARSEFWLGQFAVVQRQIGNSIIVYDHDKFDGSFVVNPQDD